MYGLEKLEAVIIDFMDKSFLETGVDIVEISRVERMVKRWGSRFLDRVYTKRERDYCENKYNSLAARFAAKEAVMKALRTGRVGIGWKDVEVVIVKNGAPSVEFHGRAETLGEQLAIRQISLSLSHSEQYAVAFVVLLRSEDIRH